MWMLPDENKVVLCLYTPALPSVREMDGIYIYIYVYATGGHPFQRMNLWWSCVPCVYSPAR